MDTVKKPTPERIEIEKYVKEAQAHANMLAMKADLSEQGIDTSKVSHQTLDEIKRCNDKKVKIQQGYQKTISDVQAAAQQRMQTEIAEVDLESNRIIAGILAEQGIVPGLSLVNAKQAYSEGAE